MFTDIIQNTFMTAIKKDITKLYSIKKYAKLMGVDPRTVYNWIKDPEKKLIVVEISDKKFIQLNS